MSTSPVIPKEQQSAYQRWELGSFDQPKAHAATVTNIERAKAIDDHARNEGFRAGHHDGLEAGRREARAEAEPRIARMDELLASLTTDLTRVDKELAEEVVQLALAVARKLVGAALEARPETVQACVEEALRHVVLAQGTLCVSVHPEDAAIVRSHLETSPRSGAWVISEDTKIARGGCRIETGTGEVDATLQHRWARITAALCVCNDWVD